MARELVDDDDWDDDESPDVDMDDLDSDDDEATMPCPYCNWLIPEDTPRCPYCENYISSEDSPPSRKPLWIIAGALLCLYIVYRWIAG